MSMKIKNKPVRLSIHFRNIPVSKILPLVILIDVHNSCICYTNIDAFPSNISTVYLGLRNKDIFQ